jgi:uncharacterized protein (TIGR02145 family)
MGGNGSYDYFTENVSQRWRAYPNNFIYSGVYYSDSSPSATGRNTYGEYWSSTGASSVFGPKRFYFSRDVIDLGKDDISSGGYSVRCIVDPNDVNGISSMQDFDDLSSEERETIVASIVQSKQYQIIDERDDKAYAIAKLADGNIWMTQNLRLDLSSASITKENTNNPTDNFIGEASISSPTYSSWCTAMSSSCFERVLYYHDGYGLAFYNWYTATAGHGLYDTANGDVVGDLCPAGWHLPNNSQFSSLANATGNDMSTIMASPNNFVKDGIYAAYRYDSVISQGEYGEYWSSTAQSTDEAHALVLSGDLYPTSYDFKGDGASVRCMLTM